MGVNSYTNRILIQHSDAWPGINPDLTLLGESYHILDFINFVFKALTLGLLELYQKVKEKFRPTPTHAHYIFSLHDISRVVQGILLMSPRSRTRKMMKIKKDSMLHLIFYINA